MKASPTAVYDGHPDSPRMMYYLADGTRFTPEQWQLMQFMGRLEKKFDRIIELLEDQQLKEAP